MDIADINRRIENVLRLGTIHAVDHDARTLRVKSGDLVTDWLPWPADIGRNYKRWRPLRVGTQVILGSVSGQCEQALIIGMLYTQALDTPSTDDGTDIIEFDDGSIVEHNTSGMKVHSAGTLNITAAGTINITSGSAINLNAPSINLN
jgi:phage baseplate assembly protein V